MKRTWSLIAGYGYADEVGEGKKGSNQPEVMCCLRIYRYIHSSRDHIDFSLRISTSFLAPLKKLVNKTKGHKVIKRRLDNLTNNLASPGEELKHLKNLPRFRKRKKNET